MKNISRRVFIKGMAVAAVATAASTVLTGCNLPVAGGDQPVAGFSPVSKTLTFNAEEEQVLTLTATSLSTTYDDKIKVGFSIVNNSDQTIYFYSNTNKSGTDVNVKVDAYLDDSYKTSNIIVNTNDNIYYDTSNKVKYPSNSEAKGQTSTYAYDGYLYVDPADKEWKTLTLLFTLSDAENKEQEIRFILNK